MPNPPCSGCSHPADCGSCRDLYLTLDELEALRRFASLPFLPLARSAGDEKPVCLELDGTPERVAAVLRGLESKGLISLDYHLPLSNYDYSAYASWPLHGSMALTAAGQEALESLEIQGVEDQGDTDGFPRSGRQP